VPRTALNEPAIHDRLLTAEQAGEASRFSLQIHPSLEDWGVVEQWMVSEGWDPGRGDAQAVIALDQRALLIGMLDGEPISAVSLLRVSDEYAFLGNYIVREAFRGRGFGLATWRAALPHAGTRVIGLEAVPGELETYRRAGFTTSHNTICYRGTIPDRAAPQNPGVRAMTSADHEAVAALDALCSPHPRPGFLTAWLKVEGAEALVFCNRHEITGFGVARPSRTGRRIGPLIANTPFAARALYDALTAAHPGEPVYLNAPEPNTAAHDLAREQGLTEDSYTIRMYSRATRPVGLTRNYSIASLAWG